mgnify:CR=1 FL=1
MDNYEELFEKYNIDNEIDLDAFESKGFSIDLEDEEFEAEV